MAESRRCPHCGEMRYWDPENGGGAWYIRYRTQWKSTEDCVEYKVTVAIPDSICRECRKARTKVDKPKARQKAKQRTPVEKLLADLAESSPEYGERPGTCQACGDDTLVLIIAWPSPAFLCRPCRGVLGEIGPGIDGRDQGRVAAILRVLSEHNAKERELEDAVRPGETREDHHGNKMAGAEDHRSCVALERHARAVIRWIDETRE